MDDIGLDDTELEAVLAGNVGNPFYLLMGWLHGLAGRSDPEFLSHYTSKPRDGDANLPMPAIPIVLQDDENFEKDLTWFMKWHDKFLWSGYLGKQTESTMQVLASGVTNSWFVETAGRMALARWQWCNVQKHSAYQTAVNIGAHDWRAACIEWMQRRTR